MLCNHHCAVKRSYHRKDGDLRQAACMAVLQDATVTEGTHATPMRVATAEHTCTGRGPLLSRT